VLGSPEARQELESGASLDIAYGFTTGVSDDLMKHLQTAKVALRAANGLAPSCVPSVGLTRITDDLGELLASLADTLARKARRTASKV